MADEDEDIDHLSLQAHGYIQWAAEDSDSSPWSIAVGDSGGDANPQMFLGYNVLPQAQKINPDDKGLVWVIEADYDDLSGHNKMEAYLQYQINDGFFGDDIRRPIMFQIDKVTDLPYSLFLGSGVDNGIIFCIFDGSGSEQEKTVGKQKAIIYENQFLINNQAGGSTTALIVDSQVTEAATGLRIRSDTATNGVHLVPTSPGADESLYLDGRGTGPVILQSDSGGPVLAPTPAPGTNNTQVATTAFTQAAIAALIDGAPGALDTLKELADAINDDANFAATITTALASKAPLSGNAPNLSVGSAALLDTARNIDGQSFDGSADITVIAPGTHAATGKTNPVDADELPLVDSAASNVLKKLTWANLKATLKTYFDTLYVMPAGTAYSPNVASGTVGSTPATYSVNSATYMRNGKQCTVTVDIAVANQGVGAGGSILVDLPFPAAARKFVGTSYEYANTGKSGRAYVNISGTNMQCRDATAATYIATDNGIVAEVTYETI